MKIKLIYPKMHDTSRGTKVKYRLVPPQSLLALAALTPPENILEIHDENVSPLRTDDSPDLVGITVYVASARRAYEIATRYRERRIPVVMGGLHVSALPDEAMLYADAIVLGEAEETWHQVIADAARGRLQRRYPEHEIPCTLQSKPTSAHPKNVPPSGLTATVQREVRTGCVPWGSKGVGAVSLRCRRMIPKWTYLTRNSLLATRGCNRHCAFCYRSSQPDSPFRCRPVEDVIAEVKEMGGGCFVLLDDNLAADRRYARSLFGALRGASKVWMGAASIDVADDERLLDLMAESGCCSLFIGLESIRQENLDRMGKSSNCVALYRESVRRIRARGIMVNGSFIFGFDADDVGVFDRTTDWAQEMCLDTATFHILTPYPGTPLFRQMECEGRILDRNWSHYDTAHVVFQPMQMAPDELAEGYERTYDRFYTWGSILKRLAADPWGRVPRLMLNTGYKRMNMLWPWLNRLGLSAVPFRLFVAALKHHRRSWQWSLAGDAVARGKPAWRYTT
jgi:radical SAM superfamily enzyme YgiQ (UPF0313 family)